MAQVVYTNHVKKVLWFVQELLEAYEAETTATGRPRLMLTAAVASGKATIDGGYEIAEISR